MTESRIPESPIIDVGTARKPPPPMPEKIATAVSEAMGKVGYVQKRGWNDEHKYKFVAIGDVLLEVQAAMVEAGLIIIQVEGPASLMFDNTILKIKYDFYLQHKSGVIWDFAIEKTGISRIKFRQGGIDDKAFNKCSTSANKYFLIELFKIPSGDMADPDNDGDERPAKQVNGSGVPVEEGGLPDHPIPPTKGSQEMEASANEWATEFESKIRETKTVDSLVKLRSLAAETLDKLERHYPKRFATLELVDGQHREAMGWG